mgnify:CR=1 FL=1
MQISLGSVTLKKVPDDQLIEAHRTLFNALFALIENKRNECLRLESENREERATAELSLKVKKWSQI